MDHAQPYADELNYWKTSNVSADSWLTRARMEIKKVGGNVIAEGYYSENGQAAFMMMFTFGSDRFRAVWPILRPRSEKDTEAARRQAATMLYHDIKGRCVRIKVFGARTTFLDWLLLPSGHTAAEHTSEELIELLPDGTRNILLARVGVGG